MDTSSSTKHVMKDVKSKMGNTRLIEPGRLRVSIVVLDARSSPMDDREDGERLAGVHVRVLFTSRWHPPIGPYLSSKYDKDEEAYVIVPYRVPPMVPSVPLVLLLLVPSVGELVMFRRSRFRGGRVALYCLTVPSAVLVSSSASSLRRRGVVSLLGVDVDVGVEVEMKVGVGVGLEAE